MQWCNTDQNTNEWLDIRAGKVTGSKFGTFMANDPGGFGDPAKRYAVQVAIERITGIRSGQGFSNEHTERGHEQEPVAKRAYEDRYFVDVLPGGFFCDDHVGVSPDGLVGNDGVIEIKSVIAPVHYATIKRCSFDPSYTWQLAGHLDATCRDWVDFVSYCAEFPEDKQLFVHRIYREDFKDKIDRLRERRAKFLDYIKQIEQDIINYEY